MRKTGSDPHKTRERILACASAQFAARGYWPAVTMPDGAKSQVSGMPFKLSKTPRMRRLTIA